MKKLAILFLLTIVLASFTFAQVTVKGGLDISNLGGGDVIAIDKLVAALQSGTPYAPTDKADPALYTVFSGTAKTALGPGSIGAELSLGTQLSFEKTTPAYAAHGDNYLKGFYELAAGPGTLTFAVSAWNAVGTGFGDLHFVAGYAGLAAGPATLGFGLEYDLRTNGKNSKGEGIPFEDHKSQGKLADAFDLKVTADFAFGLGIEYHFNYALATDTAIDENYIAEIAKLNIFYTLPSLPLKIGAELTGTGGWNYADKEQAFFGGDGTSGFGLRPYAEYAISEKVSAGLEIPISQINGDSDFVDDIIIGAGVWVSYTF
jgi:hypothetical protein